MMFSPSTRAAGESRHKEAPAVQEEDSAMTLPSQLADERKMGRTNVAVSPSDSSLLQPQKPPRDERALDYEDFLVVRELCLAGSSHVHAVVFSGAKGGSATSAGVARVEGTVIEEVLDGTLVVLTRGRCTKYKPRGSHRD